MKESVFEMSFEAYVEEGGMEMEGHLGRTPHFFVSPVQASPGQQEVSAWTRPLWRRK